MAYQFVHIQTYCPKLMQVSGTEDQFNSTEQVFGEAARDPHYSKHVEGPQRPIAVKNFGAVSVAELRRLHDERRAEIRETVRGSGGKRYQRRLKCDFPTLYTEIHSHPMTTEDYKTASPDAQAQVGAWANAALKDFVCRMPEGVRFAAVVHLDEAHVHFHILAVNMADPKMSANKLHAGKIAAEKWRQENGSSTTLEALPRPLLASRPNKPRKPRPSKNRTTQAKRDAAHAVAVSAWEADCAEVEIANATAVAEWEVENAVHLQAGRKARKAKVEDVDAYQSAMVAFQDGYFEAVGKPCGLLRNGPGTERLSTKQYAARKTRAREMADQDAALRAMAERNAEEAKRLKDSADRLNADRQALEAAQNAHEKRRPWSRRWPMASRRLVIWWSKPRPESSRSRTASRALRGCHSSSNGCLEQQRKNARRCSRSSRRLWGFFTGWFPREGPRTRRNGRRVTSVVQIRIGDLA